MIKLRRPLQPSTLLLLLAEMMTANNLSAEVDVMIEPSIPAVEVSDIEVSSPPNGRLMAQGRALHAGADDEDPARCSFEREVTSSRRTQ
jgi:hypothetical protein